MKASRQSFETIERGRVLYAGATADCEPKPPSQVGQSFCEVDSLRMREDEAIELIVHRGKRLQISGFKLVASHTELLVLFNSRYDGQRHISLDEVIARLTGCAIGNGPVIRHGGALNLQTQQFILDNLGAGPLSDRNTYCFCSYPELARACTGIRNAFVVGLRGADADHEHLQPLVVSGVDPLDAMSRHDYPLKLQVYVYMRVQRQEASVDSALQYLRAIRQRVAVDNCVLFGKLGQDALQDDSWAIGKTAVAQLARSLGGSARYLAAL